MSPNCWGTPFSHQFLARIPVLKTRTLVTSETEVSGRIAATRFAAMALSDGAFTGCCRQRQVCLNYRYRQVDCGHWFADHGGRRVQSNSGGVRTATPEGCIQSRTSRSAAIYGHFV